MLWRRFWRIYHRFLPVMEKLSRPCLQVSWPLSVVRFERHSGQVRHFVRIVLSPRAERKHGQQTQQQTSTEHGWSPGHVSNTKRTPKINPCAWRGKRKKKRSLQLPRLQLRVKLNVIWPAGWVTWLTWRCRTQILKFRNRYEEFKCQLLVVGFFYVFSFVFSFTLYCWKTKLTFSF